MRHAVVNFLRGIDPLQLRAALHFCPLCRQRRPFIRLARDEIGVRCIGCRATPVTLSLVDVLLQIHPDLSQKAVFELSSRGPLFTFLQQHASSVAGSEFFPDVAPGDYRGSVQCQDVQSLTHASEHFDICTSTEVFEHVPDDALGFAEMFRVLKPGGSLVFTVPLSDCEQTVERARVSADGTVEHLLAPEYHGDPVGAEGRVLAFRNYGRDIVERLRAAGFQSAGIRRPGVIAPWAFARAVVVAHKHC